MAVSKLELEVPADHLPGGRLDLYLIAAPEIRVLELSRSRLQRLIRDGHVCIDGVAASPRRKLRGGEHIAVDLEAIHASTAADGHQAPEPEAISVDILFEDEHLIVVNKPVGLVVHPGAGNPTGTLVNALLHHCHGQLASLEGSVDIERPGIVHRLDKETSGCLVVAKSDLAHRSLVAQFSERRTRKIYRCVVAGHPPAESGRIDNHIARHPVQRQLMAIVPEPAGKQAITEYRVLEHADDESWSHIECHLLTGRTHQIRVHMKESLRCPILGDTIYGKPARDPVKTGRLMLHALELGFDHPASDERMDFCAPLPAAFERFQKR